MIFNPKSLTKAEFNKRVNFRCKEHHHNGLEHHCCYDRANGIVEKLAFLDIEATDLSAPWGFIICYVLGDEQGNLIKRCITLLDLYNAQFDKNLLRQFCEDIKPFDRIIGHYIGDRKYDIPMLRSRAELWRLPFPLHKFHYITDTHLILKNKFRLKSNSLRSGCEYFGIGAKQHPIVTKYWNNLMTGNTKLMQEAIDYILVHCVEDVVSTMKLFKRIGKYVKLNKTSI
jgi:uncharacterized protein YprB with RNaseH-like and TPR domain